MGMVAGAALLGPVGFVAGSLVGGSAAKSSMAALTGDPKKKKPIEEHRPSANDANATQYQSNSQAPDLLSSEYQQNVPPPSTPRTQSAHPQQTRQRGAVQQQHQHHYPPQQGNHSSMPATAHEANDHGHEGYRFGE